MFATKSYELAGFSAVSADELCFVNGGSTGYSGWDGNPNGVGTPKQSDEYTKQNRKVYDAVMGVAKPVSSIVEPPLGLALELIDVVVKTVRN